MVFAARLCLSPRLTPLWEADSWGESRPLWGGEGGSGVRDDALCGVVRSRDGRCGARFGPREACHRALRGPLRPAAERAGHLPQVFPSQSGVKQGRRPRGVLRGALLGCVCLSPRLTSLWTADVWGESRPLWGGEGGSGVRDGALCGVVRSRGVGVAGRCSGRVRRVIAHSAAPSVPPQSGGPPPPSVSLPKRSETGEETAWRVARCSNRRLAVGVARLCLSPRLTPLWEADVWGESRPLWGGEGGSGVRDDASCASYAVAT